MKESFRTWAFNGVHYIATTAGAMGVQVMDHTGAYYGIWSTVQLFRQYQREGSLAIRKQGESRLLQVPK